MKQRSITLLPVIEEIAKIGCYETDLSTGTWVGSDNFIKIFGLDKKPSYTVAEFQALVHPDDFEWVMAYFNECLKNQNDFNCEYRCITKKGETIFVNSRSKVYYLADGTPERVLGVKQDVTLSKENERRLNQLNENNLRKNEVLSMVAHDLRSPIHQLEGLAHIMKKEIDEQFHELINLQQNICKHAQGIITEIVEIAELEDEAYRLRTTLTDVNALIDQVILDFKFNAQEKSITVKTVFSDECSALVNVEKFSSVIRNLLSNALKFSPEHSRIEIGTGNYESVFTVSVRDEGIGIKKEYIPMLFDKFSKTTRRSGTKGEQSIGLGLSIVKRICDLHNATIFVESLENMGTTFILSFPKVSG